MDYTEIHNAVKAVGLTWATAARSIGCSPSNLMGVAKRRANSRPVAQRLALLIDKPLSEIFPDVPAYAEPAVTELRQASIEAARKRLIDAGLPPLSMKTA